MSQEKITIPRASDRDIGNFFVEISKLFGLTQFNYSRIGGNNSSADPKSPPKFMKDPHSFSISSASISYGNYPIRFGRGSGGQTASYAFDHLDIGQGSYSNDRTQLTDDQITSFNEAVRKNFLAKKEIASAIFGDPKAFSEVIASHQTIAVRLEDTITTLVEKIAEEKIKLQQEFDRNKKKLEIDYKEKLNELKESEKEIEERRMSLDDRDNTHARRQIRADLKRRIEEHAKSFELTRGTKSLRRPIHVAAVFSLIAIGGLAAFYIFGSLFAVSSSQNVTEIVFALLKPVGLTIAFLGILTWYLRWMNRWFERHSEAEFQLKQFELDVDRASWVVETALEWRQTQDTTMPDHLIESISRNLFSRSEKDEGADMHPADYLASALLGRASGLRLKLPGGEIEYGPKALKEAGSAAAAKRD